MYCVISKRFIFNCNTLSDLIVYLFEKDIYFKSSTEELKNNYIIYEYDELNNIQKKYNGLELLQQINKVNYETINIIKSNYKKLIETLNSVKNINYKNIDKYLNFIKSLNEFNKIISNYIYKLNSNKNEIFDEDDFDIDKYINKETKDIPNYKNFIEDNNSEEINNINPFIKGNINVINPSTIEINPFITEDILKQDNKPITSDLKNNNDTSLNTFFEPLFNDDENEVNPINYDDNTIQNCITLNDFNKPLKSNDIKKKTFNQKQSNLEQENLDKDNTKYNFNFQVLNSIKNDKIDKKYNNMLKKKQLKNKDDTLNKDIIDKRLYDHDFKMLLNLYKNKKIDDNTFNELLKKMIN